MKRLILILILAAGSAGAENEVHKIAGFEHYPEVYASNGVLYGMSVYTNKTADGKTYYRLYRTKEPVGTVKMLAEAGEICKVYGHRFPDDTFAPYPCGKKCCLCGAIEKVIVDYIRCGGCGVLKKVTKTEITGEKP